MREGAAPIRGRPRRARAGSAAPQPAARAAIRWVTLSGSAPPGLCFPACQRRGPDPVVLWGFAGAAPVLGRPSRWCPDRWLRTLTPIHLSGKRIERPVHARLHCAQTLQQS